MSHKKGPRSALDATLLKDGPDLWNAPRIGREAMALGIGFYCPACLDPVDRESFPLCATCRDALVPAPTLCPQCASPVCPALGAACTRPWTHRERSDLPSAIRSYTARYLCVGPGYTVLRRWKTSHGPFFDRQVLRLDAGVLSRLKSTEAEMAVPIPQNPERSWKLGGSPALKIAEWIAPQLHIKVTEPLRLPLGAKKTPQAELRLLERMTNRVPFEPTHQIATIRGHRVLLVDDFMTTGRTLRKAALSLMFHGAREVHAFCLGLRPRFSQDANAELEFQKSGHLLSRAGRPKAITHE